MMRRLVIAAFWLIGLSSSAVAQNAAQTPQNLYYVVQRDAKMYSRSDTTRPYLSLKFREPLFVTGTRGRFYEIRTKDGAQGLIERSALSNMWIRVSKSQQTIYVFRGTEMIRQIPADLGYNAFADKEKRGNAKERDHWRTPEGTFFVVDKNPRSQFHKALVLNYPTTEDAERGLKQGIITQQEYAAIARAEAAFEAPPMNTGLGGMIEIHGHGTGARSNWTQGCIAVRDDHIDSIFNMVPVGTPVLVEP